LLGVSSFVDFNEFLNFVPADGTFIQVFRASNACTVVLTWQ